MTPAPSGLSAEQDRCLQPIGVLVFVDEHVVEALADVARERRLRHHVGPVEQQVVVVEDVLRLLRGDVGVEQLRQLALPLRAPREHGGEHVGERVPPLTTRE